MRQSRKDQSGPDERLMKTVVAKHLEIYKKKVQPAKGAGPDFVFNGEIIETKGTDFDFDRAVKQMLDYAPKYRALSLALPIEAFTAQRVMQLNTLAKVIYKQHSKMLKLLCVVLAQQPNIYKVAEINPLTVAYNVAETIGNMDIWSYPETQAKPKNYEADRIQEIDILVQSALKQLIIRATDSATVVV